MQGLNMYPSVKSTINSFARWLMEEKGLLQCNPTRGIDLPSRQVLASRQLSEDQRCAAIFALGYWAECRVSDVSWLQMTYIRMRFKPTVCHSQASREQVKGKLKYVRG